MKRFLIALALGCCAAICMNAAGGASLTRLGSGTVAVSTSPDGKYVVGYFADLTGETSGSASFLYDTGTGKTEWLETAEEGNPASGALFNYVSNSGVIVGNSLDPDNSFTWTDDESGTDKTTPLNVATIWKEGKKIRLGYGTFAPSDFKYYGNGSYAVSCNDDGTLVNGYIHAGSTYATKACRWTYNAKTDTYDYEELPGIDNPNYYELSSFQASADGNIFAGEAKVGGMLGKRQFLVFDEYGECEIFDPYGTNPNGTAWIYDISKNGKYGLFFSYDLANNMRAGVWNFEKGSIEWIITLPDGYEILNAAGQTIDDNGCGYIWTDEGDLLYYSMPDRVCMKAGDYFDSFDEKITGYTGASKFVIYDTSADGNVIVGNTGDFTYGGLEAFVMTLPDSKPMITNNVSGVRAYYSSPTEITLEWEELRVPEGAKVVAYTTSIGTNVTTTAVADLEKDQYNKYRITGEGMPGAYVGCTVAAKIEANGKKYTTPESTATIYMSSSTELFFYEDYDNCPITPDGHNVTYDGDVWQQVAQPNADVKPWILSFNDYANNTPFFTTMSTSMAPWNSDMITHFLDASDAKDDMYFTFYLIKKNINGSPVDAGDKLELQWSENGRNWNTLISFNSADYAANNWNFFKVNCNELRGKVFQLRWHAHGDGVGFLEWRLDYMGMVKDAKTPAPLYVRTLGDGSNGVDIEWGNEGGAYEFSYLYNHPVVAEQSVGNEGKPLMVGIMMNEEQARPYVGMEVKTISSLIWDNPQKQKTPTYMEGVVLENGKIVSRVEFPAPDDLETVEFGPQMAVFDTPVTIKPGCEYIFAVNIEDYANDAQPLWYQVRKEACVPGSSDLYSEDGGKTWNWFSDLYIDEQSQDTYGWAVWPIRVGIQPAECALLANEYDFTLWGYNVYRDGNRLNNRCQYYTAPRFHDADGSPDHQYTVEAFYTDGRVSVMSANAVNKVESIATDGNLDVTVEGNSLVLNGNAIANVYDTKGMKVAVLTGANRSVTLPAGIYLVTSETREGVNAAKVVIRNR